MKLLITGASGLVGTALSQHVAAQGHDVYALTRTPKSDNEIGWDPAQGKLNSADIEGMDAVVHLAGESIAEGRWDEAKKKRIYDSRVKGTQLLSQTLATLQAKPKVLVSTSAIGYYGDRGDETLDEQSEPGHELFLTEVCKAWEAATDSASNAEIRVVHARLGMVLSSDGGAISKMLLPFKMGVGGRIGSGHQYWSWITLTDVVHAFTHVIDHENLRGAVNFVAPNPVTNREFTKAMGQALKRPTVFPMPAFAARLALGEMASELLLPSARVYPRQLEASGFQFEHAELPTALDAVLN